jgi:hypothetical protein
VIRWRPAARDFIAIDVALHKNYSIGDRWRAAGAYRRARRFGRSGTDSDETMCLLVERFNEPTIV